MIPLVKNINAMVCYFPENIINGNIFFVLRLHTSEAYSEPSQTPKMKRFVNVINSFQEKAAS